MAVYREFTFRSQDGIHDIHAAIWLPDDISAPKGIVQISHGVAEHIGRYDNFARALTEHGYIVAGNDHLGHGLSAKNSSELGFFAEKNGWFKAAGDVYRLSELMRQEYGAGGLPYFLLGHSMGSFLARTYLIEHPGYLDGCIISGTGFMPAAMLDAGLFLSALEKLRIGPRGKSKLVYNLCFGSYNKRISPLRTDCDWLSRSSENVDRYIADELCGFVGSVGLYSDMFRGIKFVCNRKNIEKMDKKTPIFFFAGKEDPVGNYGAGVKKAYDAFLSSGCENVSIKLYPGGRHEMLNETNCDEVYSDVIAWLDRVAGGRVAAGSVTVK